LARTKILDANYSILAQYSRVNTPSNTAPAAFRLGELYVHPATGRVAGPTGKSHLEPRVMAVLEMLASKAGHLVSRSELLAGIWPGGEVYDEALTQCVYQLRQQLVAVGGDETFRNLIVTVPKRGYVLKGDVKPVATGPVEAQPPDTVLPRSLLIVALAAVVLLFTVWAVFRWQGAAEPSPTLAAGMTVAVLPFLPLVADHREPVMEMGMADTLITRLSGVRQLIVRPMTSVRQYAALDRDSLQAGRELGAEAVVEGSVHRLDETLRVTVRLLRVADGQALWTDTFSEPFSNVFRVQDDICARIVAALSPELGQDEQHELAKVGTAIIEAYENYLQGRYHLNLLNPQDLRASIDYFRKAVALDPDYAQAWLGLASVQFRIPIAGEVPPREFYPLARQAAEKALELDSSLAEGYAMLGWIEHWFEWNWVASESHFRRAIEMNPNDTESHLGYAHLLSSTGRHEQAIEEVRRARELSPNYPVAAALEGGFLLRAGRGEEALRRMEAARPVGENLWLFHVTIAGAFSSTGRLDEALKSVKRARELSGDSTWAMANEIGMLVQMGRRPEAERVFNEMLQRSSERYVPPYDLAVGYHSLGDLDSALAMLLRGYEVRDPKLAMLGVSSWTSISDRPEYQGLLQRMNFQAVMK
jgi:serine/threonine-protein kinase